MVVHATNAQASGDACMPPGSAFAARLKDLRLRCGYSLRRLGRLVHYSHGYLWQLESGQKRPTAAVAAALDRALGADGALTALIDYQNAGHVVADGRFGVRAAAGAARSGADAVGVAEVRVRVGAGAQVVVVCHDGAQSEVAVFAGSVRVLIDACAVDPTGVAASADELPSPPGMARVYSMAERRAG